MQVGRGLRTPWMSRAPWVARAPLAALIAASAGWGLATCATKYALAGFAPVTLLAISLVAATTALWTLLLLRGSRGGNGLRRQRPPWRRVVVLGALEPALAYLALTLGLAHTSAANGTVIEGLESAAVVVLAAVFLRERITRPLCLALVAGFVGLGVLEHVRWADGPQLGDMLVLGGVLAAAIYTIVARGLPDDVDSVVLTTYQFTVAAALIVPVMAVTWVTGSEPVPTGVPPQYWIVAVLLGVVGFAGSFVLYNWAIVRTDARSAAIVLNLIPIFGLLGAVVWLDEELSTARVMGAALITLSVALFARAEMEPVALPDHRSPTPEEVPLCL